MGDGAFVSLSEVERQEEEKATKQELKKKLDEENLLRNRASEIYWAYTFYVLGAGPCFLCLVTVLVGPYIHKVSAKCVNQPLDGKQVTFEHQCAFEIDVTNFCSTYLQTKST